MNDLQVSWPQVQGRQRKINAKQLIKHHLEQRQNSTKEVKSKASQGTLTALFWAFIRTIFTVRVPIALPSVRNTLTIFAHEVRLGTCLLYYKSLFSELELKSIAPDPNFHIRVKTIFWYVFL